MDGGDALSSRVAETPAPELQDQSQAESPNVDGDTDESRGSANLLIPLEPCSSSDSDLSLGPSSWESTGSGDLLKVAGDDPRPPAPLVRLRADSSSPVPVACLKLSPFKNRGRPQLPMLIGAASGVNPFEPGKVRKARSCECFFAAEDAREWTHECGEEARLQEVTLREAPAAHPPTAVRSILRSGRSSSRRLSASWSPAVRTPVVIAPAVALCC
eukprot:TRINITY_DN10677_c0_g1_i1.p2 TRINITY_DN10677_c0_g1~~TRINITY_DN10677_c0_g1_i1.p2  ORF type:complete len:215 (+),score=31.58 TRINITY_DN10677_c0_g1_i1:265-909(+)